MRTSQEFRQKILPYFLIVPVILYYTLFWLYPVIRCAIESFQRPGVHLTEQSVKSLQDEGLPDNVLTELTRFGDQKFSTKTELGKALESHLDEEELASHKKAILKHAESTNILFTTQNYAEIFRDPYFYKACYNTAFIVIFSVALEFVVAFGLALLINMKFKGAGIFLFIAMIPMALPPIAVGAMWSSGFATYGWLNSFLYTIGLIGEAEKIKFLADASLGLIVIVDAWQVIPFMMIILLAGMQNLNKEYLEAGYIFGADKFTVLRKLTIPLLKPTITTAMILRIISAIQIWLIIVMIYGYRRLPVLVEQLVYLKRELRGPKALQLSTAYSVLIALIVSAMAILYLKISGAFKNED
jgi:multiple sugar transport system permease protein